MKDLSRYRPNVGVVLFHPDGRVWYGRRAGTPEPWNWQFPQGGVDDGEDLETAARRELGEETGVTSADLIAQTQEWIVYDFPADYGGSKAARGWSGQKQKWFAFRFTGEETEINLEAHGDIEFDAWRWGPLADAPDLIVPFKRPVYEQVVAAFAPLVV
jgi:putative (di)nucleoside polyphosphate hydrolase